MPSECAACHSAILGAVPDDAGTRRALKLNRERLGSLTRRCEAVKTRIQDVLRDQIASHELLQRAHAAEERVRVLSLRATHAAARLAERQREVCARRGRLAERRVAARAQWGTLEDTEQRLQEARHEAGKGAVACMMATEGLQARQQRELAALSGALAVRISGVSRSDGTTMQVSINNAPVPELPARLPEAMRADPVKVSTACGHLVLYLRLLASVLGAPLLHESGYMGSSSAVWQPGSFWAAAPAGARLQLWHTPSQLPFWPQADHAPDSQQLSRHDSALQSALRALLRSAACACQHYAAPRGLAPPMHWSPFAWLALVHETSQGGSQLWEMATGGAGCGGGSPAARTRLHACFADVEDAYGDWVAVESPADMLPPPPSNDEHTRDWERAIFIDRQEPGSAAASARVVGTVTSLLRRGSTAL